MTENSVSYEAIESSKNFDNQNLQPSSDPTNIDTPNQLIIKLEQDTKDINKKQIIILYVPVYVRLMVKNFSQLEFDQLNGVINVTLLIGIYVEGMGKNTVQAIKNHLRISFSKDGSFKLADEDSLETNNDDVDVHGNGKQKFKVLDFTLRKFVNTKVEPYIFLTPFQIIDFILSIEFRKIEIMTNTQPYKQAIFKFQCMEAEDHEIMFNYHESCLLGNYHLAEKRIVMEFSRESTPKTLMQLGKNNYNISCLDQRREVIQQKKKSKSIEAEQAQYKPIMEEQNFKEEYAQNVHMHIPVFRYPLVPLLLVFVPLCSLGVINLAIFFQSPALGDRISSLANLMIAFIFLVPGIRSQIPPNPDITIIEMLVFLEIATAFLCLVQSLIHRQDGQDEYIQNYQVYEDALYWISMIITIGMFLVPVVTYIIHRCQLGTHRAPPFPRIKKEQVDYRAKWEKNTESKKWLEQLKTMKQNQDKQEKIMSKLKIESILYERSKSQEFYEKMKDVQTIMEQHIRDSNEKKKNQESKIKAKQEKRHQIEISKKQKREKSMLTRSRISPT